MQPISAYLNENFLICDGAFGTYYAEKYNTKELPELANLSAPERVREIHEEYVSAGAKPKSSHLTLEIERHRYSEEFTAIAKDFYLKM